MKRIGLALMALVLVAWCLVLVIAGSAGAADRPFSWHWRAARWHCGVYYPGGWYKVYHDPPAHHDRQTYSASYDPEKAELLALAKSLADTASKLAGQGGRAATVVADGPTVLKTRCASCHAEDKAEEKGKGFVMVLKDGALAPFSLGEKKAITKRVTSPDAGIRMPPAAPLSAAELQAVSTYLVAPAKAD